MSYRSTISTELSEEDAFDSIYEAVPLSEGQGFLCHGIQVVDYYECYIFSLYEDLPDHITTLGYYAVDPFGYVYEQDYLTWEYFIVE